MPNLPVVLLTGASGFVGGRLIPLLERQPVTLRCLARNRDKLRPLVKESTQIVRGDVLDPPSLDEALQGVTTAYYLVHLMSGSKDFEKDDRQAATNFAQSAKKAGVRRIIYLGGLGDDNPTVEFRARIVIGHAPSIQALFEFFRHRRRFIRLLVVATDGAGVQGGLCQRVVQVDPVIGCVSFVRASYG